MPRPRAARPRAAPGGTGTSESDTARVALRFVNEINRHDVESLLALLTEDHVMIDADGIEVRGRDRLRSAWTDRFRAFPDYHLGVKEWFQSGRTVGMFGTASGTFAVGAQLPAENRWRAPAAWRAVVRDHRIAQWQAYLDPAPSLRSMDAHKLEPGRTGEPAAPPGNGSVPASPDA
jgi:ketosteroid isomerase-like protein